MKYIIAIVVFVTVANAALYPFQADDYRPLLDAPRPAPAVSSSYFSRGYSGNRGNQPVNTRSGYPQAASVQHAYPHFAQYAQPATGYAKPSFYVQPASVYAQPASVYAPPSSAFPPFYNQ